MLCETCHKKEATVHIASIMHAAANVDARHFCEPCAQVAQIANPVLSVTARNLPPVHVKPVMGIATPAKVKIQTVEKKLSELDPIWESFCARHEYRFLPGRELWPNRMAWGHGEIEHRLALTTDLTFAEVLERGFHAEMPWSLYAMATIPMLRYSQGKVIQVSLSPPGSLHPVLTFELFRRVAFSELSDVLEKQLERGFSMLNEVTREDILQKGEVPKGSLAGFRHYPW